MNLGSDRDAPHDRRRWRLRVLASSSMLRSSGLHFGFFVVTVHRDTLPDAAYEVFLLFWRYRVAWRGLSGVQGNGDTALESKNIFTGEAVACPVLPWRHKTFAMHGPDLEGYPEEPNPMKISVIGTGYVGLVTGTCLSEVGNDVMCFDTDADKVSRLQNGEIRSLRTRFAGHGPAQRQRRDACTSPVTLSRPPSLAPLQFIAVRHAAGRGRQADVQYVLAAARNIGRLHEQTTRWWWTRARCRSARPTRCAPPSPTGARASAASTRRSAWCPTPSS